MSRKRRVFVFGGSRGIGRVYAERCARAGADVSVFSRTWRSQAGEGPKFVQADFLDPSASAEIALEHLKRGGGEIHGILFAQRYRGDDQGWESEMRASVETTRLVVETLAPHFSDEGGSIVMISSNAARSVAPEQPVDYHIAKSAIEQMVRYFAYQLGARRVRVNAVAPALTIKPENEAYYAAHPKLTEMFSSATPLGRMARAEDVCGVIDFLHGPSSAFVTGQTIVVDGGLSLATPETHLRSGI